MRLLTTKPHASAATDDDARFPALLESAKKSTKHLPIRTVEHIGPPPTIPAYAILSHTWDEPSEVAFQELGLFVHSTGRWPQILAVLLPLFLCLVHVGCCWTFGASANPELLGGLTATALSFVIHYRITLHSNTDTTDVKSLIEQKQPGYNKIKQTVRLAYLHGLKHAWVDTCCINKDSSAELSESINSMYAWYAAAKVCFVYLSDLDPVAADKNLEEALPKCRWFKRGWTLQELIAPRHVIFYDRNWNERGTKDSLSSLLSKITTVPEELLGGEKRLDHYAVGRQMSWASMRETTRREDEAYCLLGIFNVSMPLLYGEGDAAFCRLQKIIVEELADLTIFVWTDGSEDEGEDGNENGKLTAKRTPWASMFATSPGQFSCAGKVEATLADSTYRNLRSGPRGIQVEASLIFLFSEIDEDDGNKCIYDTHCMIDGMPIGVMMRKIGGGRYVRYKPWKLSYWGSCLGPDRVHEPWEYLNRTLVETATLATKLPTEFPWCLGLNPVLGNRRKALKLRLRPSSPKFEVEQCRAMPRTHWDIHDNVFFSTIKTTKAWSAFFVHGYMNNTDKTCIPVNFFLGCVRWNTKNSFVILASLEDLDPGTRALLEYQLDKLEFESCRKAEAVIMSVFDGKLNDDKTTIVKTCVVDKRQIPTSNDGGTVFGGRRIFQINGLATTSPGWHCRVPSSGRKVKVEISVELNEEEDPSICVTPVMMLDLHLKLLQ